MKTKHPLAEFVLCASIDRVVIEVSLRHPTQFQHVQTRMGAAGLGVQFVHQIDPRTFRTTIQDPTGPDAFMLAVQALAPPGSGPIQERDITILEVETTLDARPTAPTGRDQLVGAAMHFVHHHANPPGNFRIVRKTGHVLGNTAPVSQTPFKLALLAGDNTIGAGWHGDVVKCEQWGDTFRLRVYVKEYDSTPGARYQPLPTAQHSARIEAVLSGSLCPFSTVAGWREFKFESLTPYFRQIRATPASQIAALSQGWLAALGLPTDTDKQADHRRNSRPGTARDTALNRKIYKALARLTQRQIAEIRPLKSGKKQAPSLVNGELVRVSPEYLIQQHLNTVDSTLQHAPPDHTAQPPKGGATLVPDQNQNDIQAHTAHPVRQCPNAALTGTSASGDLDPPRENGDLLKPLVRVFSHFSQKA